VWLFPTGSINLGFLLTENLLLCSSFLPLEVPNWPAIYINTAPQSTRTIKQFFWRCCRGEKGFLQGESLTSNLLLCYCFAYFLYFSFACIVLIKNTKN
jgi:hypothetical protein